MVRGQLAEFQDTMAFRSVGVQAAPCMRKGRGIPGPVRHGSSAGTATSDLQHAYRHALLAPSVGTAVDEVVPPAPPVAVDLSDVFVGEEHHGKDAGKPSADTQSGEPTQQTPVERVAASSPHADARSGPSHQTPLCDGDVERTTCGDTVTDQQGTWLELQSDEMLQAFLAACHAQGLDTEHRHLTQDILERRNAAQVGEPMVIGQPMAQPAGRRLATCRQRDHKSGLTAAVRRHARS